MIKKNTYIGQLYMPYEIWCVSVRVSFALTVMLWTPQVMAPVELWMDVRDVICMVSVDDLTFDVASYSNTRSGRLVM